MERDFYSRILQSIKKLMNDRDLSQAKMADYVETSPSQFSKILSGTVKLSIQQISNLATNLQMSELDIMTYPDKFVRVGAEGADPIEAVLQIKLKKDKKDQVLNLIFGEHNLEILDK